jgi:glycosyltransferase involved in cell wall biosynthesis
MKGLVPLLEAIAQLRKERNVTLTVIGNPRAGGRVERKIEQLQLRDIVTTISGVSDVELARLYGESQIAIVPSLYEGFSLPAIEAMSCGIPVVATTGGAIPEVVGPSGHAGLLVAPNNPLALKEAIQQLLDDEELRSRMSLNARERVMKRFTWSVTARGTVACYTAMMRHEALPISMEFS